MSQGIAHPGRTRDDENASISFPVVAIPSFVRSAESRFGTRSPGVFTREKLFRLHYTYVNRAPERHEKGERKKLEKK